MNMMDDVSDMRSSDGPGRKLMRYCSQDSLDECSQKPLMRLLSNDRATPFRNDLHSNMVIESFNTMRRNGLLCDVVLVAEQEEISAHKSLLAASSPYFNAMFANFEERNQARITIQAVDPAALSLLINYMYTSEVNITEENVQSLLPAAHLLQLTDVRDACCEFLENQLHPSNCLGIRAFADLHGCLELYNQSDTYIHQYFSEIIEEDEFVALPFDCLVKLIKDNRLRVSQEEEVFECVIKWVKHDADNRSTYLHSLMEHVRLPLTAKDFLLSRVEEEPMVRDNLLCKDFIIEALKYHLLNPNEQKTLKTPRTIPRLVNEPKALIVIGGQAPKAIRGVECFDIQKETWSALCEMPSRRCRAGVTVWNGKVYAIGGFNGSLRVKTVDIYDPLENKWTAGAPMEMRRSTLGVAVLDNKIYAIGGFDGSVGLDSAEVYDPKLNTWRTIERMSVRRSSVGVAVLNDFIYAVGGYDGVTHQCLSSVERYNAATKTWQLVHEMGARRSGAGVGVLDGVLYAVGGHDGPVVRSSVEVYSPLTNTWKYISDMNTCRRNAGVIGYDGKLYVVGGDDGYINLSSIEVYHPRTGKWQSISHRMHIGRSYAGVALLKSPVNHTA